ncbi:MAG: DUF3795 domain-containing protein [Candidatus Aminicenantes bacterium]|nr:DUF3795 domain-containing protein [Candidatus Aminicenantes bacterium]
MTTRKEFCRCCLAMALAGLGAPRLLAKKGDEVKREEGKEEMKKIIGYCGITCSGCPAYIATQRDDDALRARTAQEWSAMFHADIKPGDIQCDGCPGNGPRLFAHCLECEFRTCAREKKVPTCAACPEYPCRKLDEFLAQVPEARATLEALRAQ